jgi:zinc protease
VGAFRQLIVERLYNSMLNDRLFELTQQSEPPFLYGSSGQGRLIRSKEVYVLGAVVEDGGVERGLEALLTESERVARHGFTDSELERHKAELLRWMERAHAELEKTHSSAYAYEYVNAFLNGDPIPGVAAEYQYYQQFLPEIELPEVNRLAREWLADRNRVITVSAPEKEGIEVPEESALLAAFERIKNSAIEPYVDAVDDAPLVTTPPVPGSIEVEKRDELLGVATWQLSNGARVILKPTDYKDDEILFRASSPGGTSLAPDEDYIAASTAADVVGSGGLNGFSMVELQKKMAGKAVGVGASIGPLYEGLGGSASPEDIGTLFELIYLTFTEPRRDSIAYLAFRKQIEAILANRSASPAEAFQDTLTVTLTQHHYRTRPPTANVYQEMDLDKAFEFYQDRFAEAGDFTFVFVGNFEVEQMRPLVETYLASLPTTGRLESWRDVGIRPPEGIVVREVRRGIEPKSKAHIVFTGGFDYNRENSHLLSSLADVLQIRLRERLREDLGGTYSVAVAARPQRDPVETYTVQISFGADPHRLEELVGEVFEEISYLKTEGPQESDLAKVRESQRRTLETNRKQNNYWLWQLLTAERLGVDPRVVLTEESTIDGLTVEMIRQAVVNYLPHDRYVRVSLYPEKDDWQ